MGPSTPLRQRRLRLWAAVVGAAAVIAAIVVLVLPLLTRGPSTLPGRPYHAASASTAPATTVAPAPSCVPSSTPAEAAPAAANMAPVALKIPAIGVSTNVVDVGLNPDRTLQVPPLDYAGTHETAWYDLGPPPGRVGPSVIVGHVDSSTGPAVFYRLGSLAPGSTIEVTAANCQKVNFVVTSVKEYPKAQFPSQKVYGPVSDAELRLVTCGGAFDPSTGHYLSNIVAYATMAGAG